MVCYFYKTSESNISNTVRIVRCRNWRWSVVPGSPQHLFVVSSIQVKSSKSIDPIAQNPIFPRALFPVTLFASLFDLLVVAIWEAWCLHFRTLGTILAPREHHGGPWEQKAGLERVRHRISNDVTMIWGFFFERCLGIEAWDFNLLSGSYPGHLCIDFWLEI